MEMVVVSVAAVFSFNPSWRSAQSPGSSRKKACIGPQKITKQDQKTIHVQHVVWHLVKDEQMLKANVPSSFLPWTPHFTVLVHKPISKTGVLTFKFDGLPSPLLPSLAFFSH